MRATRAAVLVALTFALVLIPSASVAASARSGSGIPPATLKLWFGESGLDEIVTYVEPLLVEALQNVSAPDQKISSLGIVITLTEIHLSHFNLSEIAVVYTPPADISLTMNNLQAIATMNWEYQDGPGIDLTGTALDTIGQTSIGVDVHLSSAGDGKLQASTSLSASIGSLDIELSGPGSQFFQFIVNLIQPILVGVFQSVISGAIGGVISTVVQDLISMIPVTIPLGAGVTLNYGLIPTANLHALAGQYYSGDNSFGGGSSPVAYSDWSSVNIDNYQSYDVSGYFVAPTSGDYQFRIEYDQCCELDVNGQSIGSLEMNNPGMCWPEHSSDNTNSMTLTAGQFVPMRLRYQSGCGGGWVHLKTCDGNGNNCNVIDPMSLYTVADIEVPVAVLPTNMLELDSEAGVTWNGTAPDPYQPQQLPSTFVIAGNTQMLQFEFEQYLFDSLIWSVEQTGAFSVAITPLTIPAADDWALNTTTWKGILPGLYAEFPDQLFSIFIAATKTPALTIDPKMGMQLVADVTLNISMSPYPIHWGWGTVIQIDSVTTVALDLDIPAGSNKLVGKVTALTMDQLELVYADVPVFNVTDLLPLINVVLHDLLEPIINKALAKGFPLPVIGPLSLVNPTIQYQPGVIALATDFHFNMTKTAAATNTKPAASEDEDSLHKPAFDV